MSKREHMKKPDFMSDADWAYLKDQTSSLQRIRSDGKADVEAYLANPDGRAAGKGPSGLPTLLLTTIGRKSGEKRTVALVFLQNGHRRIACRLRSESRLVSQRLQQPQVLGTARSAQDDGRRA
jgi:hypothetical protein